MWYFPLHGSGLKQHHKANVSFSCALLTARFKPWQACAVALRWSNQSRGLPRSVPPALGAHHIREDNSASPEEFAMIRIQVGDGEEKPFSINQHICSKDCKFMRWQYLYVFALCQQVPCCPPWKQYPCLQWGPGWQGSLMPTPILGWNPLHFFAIICNMRT